jgi:hypothetical protein
MRCRPEDKTSEDGARKYCRSLFYFSLLGSCSGSSLKLNPNREVRTEKREDWIDQLFNTCAHRLINFSTSIYVAARLTSRE